MGRGTYLQNYKTCTQEHVSILWEEKGSEERVEMELERNALVNNTKKFKTRVLLW